MPVLLRRPLVAALACGAIAVLFAGSAAGDAPRPAPVTLTKPMTIRGINGVAVIRP